MYEQLRSAVRDLLSELRIDPQALEVMARGYSPDYPGAVDLSDRSCTNPNVKVQLSMVVAQKLLAAGVDETGAVDMLKEGHVKKGGVNRSPKSPKPLIKSGAQKPERVDENFTPIKYYPICDQCVAGNGESCNNPRCSYCWGRCPQEMPFSEFGARPKDQRKE